MGFCPQIIYKGSHQGQALAIPGPAAQILGSWTGGTSHSLRPHPALNSVLGKLPLQDGPFEAADCKVDLDAGGICIQGNDF